MRRWESAADALEFDLAAVRGEQELRRMRWDTAIGPFEQPENPNLGVLLALKLIYLER